MGFFSGLAKYIIFLFNFLIFLCSILLIVYGALTKRNEHITDNDFILNKYPVTNLAIAVGCLILIISFFGCCGALKENSCMLTTYAAILLTLFIIQIVLGVLAFIAIKNSDSSFDNEVEKYMKELWNKNDDDSKKVKNDIMDAFDCCGVKGNDFGCGSKQKCDVALRDYLADNAKIIGGIAVGFGVIELVGAIFALCVRNSIRRY